MFRLFASHVNQIPIFGEAYTRYILLGQLDMNQTGKGTDNLAAISIFDCFDAVR